MSENTKNNSACPVCRAIKSNPGFLLCDACWEKVPEADQVELKRLYQADKYACRRLAETIVRRMWLPLAEAKVREIMEAIIAAEPAVEFGERDGPCVVEFRDWWREGWPMRRSFSCLGCKYLTHNPEYKTHYCEHPIFLKKYKSHQSVANGSWARYGIAAVQYFSCPCLESRGCETHCPPPEREDIIPGKKRSKAYRDCELSEMFDILQRVPSYIAEAYAEGALIDSQHPRF